MGPAKRCAVYALTVSRTPSPPFPFLLCLRSAIYFSVEAAAIGGELASDGDDDLLPFSGELPPTLCNLSPNFPQPSVTFSYQGGCPPATSGWIQGSSKPEISGDDDVCHSPLQVTFSPPLCRGVAVPLNHGGAQGLSSPR